MCMKLIDYSIVEDKKTVYVVRIIDEFGIISSPFKRLTKWEIGAERVASNVNAIYGYGKGTFVEGGFFHSFPTLKLAECFLKIYKEKIMLCRDEIPCIFEAEISKCDIGIGEISAISIGGGTLCIVSPNLTLIKKISEDN